MIHQPFQLYHYNIIFFILQTIVIITLKIVTSVTKNFKKYNYLHIPHTKQSRELFYSSESYHEFFSETIILIANFKTNFRNKKITSQDFLL